jgi:hypothetical protein
VKTRTTVDAAARDMSNVAGHRRETSGTLLGHEISWAPPSRFRVAAGKEELEPCCESARS